MRRTVTYLIVLFAIVGLSTAAFTINQVQQTKAQLTDNLRYRSTLLVEALREAVEPNFADKSNTYLQTLVEKYSHKQRIAGLAVIDNTGAILAASSSLPKGLPESQKIATQAMDGDAAAGEFTGDGKLYAFAEPLHANPGVVGALIVVQHSDYINAQLGEIWKQNLTYLLIQIGIFVCLLWLVMRWFVYAPVRKMAAALRVARWANDPKSPAMGPHPLLQPLLKEVAQIQQDLDETKKLINAAGAHEHIGGKEDARS